MTEVDRPNWDDWFMGMCFWVSLRSPDPATKHGAILCNDRHQILGVGYNGFPRGGRDAELPTTRPLKYNWMVHAESNCLMNSQNLLLDGNYSMYITGMPCPNCMLLMIQAGIKTVTYGPVTSACVNENDAWVVQLLAEEYKIKVISYAKRFDLKGLLDGAKNS